MTKKQFENKCIQIADELGLEEPMFFDDTRGADAFDDDGNLHIVRAGLRAAFNVGNNEDLPGKEQNANTRAVMERLKIKVTDCVLVDEDEEDEEGYCDHCGRG